MAVSSGVERFSHVLASRQPHGGVRPFHQKSTCLSQLNLGPHVGQIWSRNAPESGPKEILGLRRAQMKYCQNAGTKRPYVTGDGHVFHHRDLFHLFYRHARERSLPPCVCGRERKRGRVSERETDRETETEGGGEGSKLSVSGDTILIPKF